MPVNLPKSETEATSLLWLSCTLMRFTALIISVAPGETVSEGMVVSGFTSSPLLSWLAVEMTTGLQGGEGPVERCVWCRCRGRVSRTAGSWQHGTASNGQ